ASLAGLFHHLEGELENAGFFHPPEKKRTMVRNLRALLTRAQMSEQEVRTLRGAVAALSRGRGRVLAKLAAKARET
ncbi:MAG: RNA methyltransferase, partial [Caulobacteraceae bacterium]